jgi:hypothetical protein
MKLWVIAILVSISIVACPSARANDGGGSKGDAAQRQLQQQQEEQVPEAATSVSAPTDAASVAARDFYTSTVAGLDSAIQEMQRRLTAREKTISEIDHRAAQDFAAERSGDKTTDDMTDSAEKVLRAINNKQAVRLAAAGGPVDSAALNVNRQLFEFKAEVAALKALQAARADMVGAARAYGATIK